MARRQTTRLVAVIMTLVLLSTFVPARAEIDPNHGAIPDPPPARILLPHRIVANMPEASVYLRVAVGGLALMQESFGTAVDRPLLLNFAYTTADRSRMQARLWRDGTLVGQGAAIATNSLTPLDVTTPGIHSAPGETRRYIPASPTTRILIAPHGVARGGAWAQRALRKTPDPEYRRQISRAAIFWDGVDLSFRKVALEYQVGVVRKPSVVLMLSGNGRFDVDILSSPLYLSSGTPANKRDFMIAAGFLLSMWERIANVKGSGVAAISAESVMTEAISQRVPIRAVRSSVDMAGIRFYGNDGQEIQPYLQYGNVVLIPERPITVGQWTGSAMIVIGADGSMDPILSGIGHSHGSTTVSFADAPAMAHADAVATAIGVAVSLAAVGATLATAGITMSATGVGAPIGLAVAVVGFANLTLAVAVIVIVLPPVVKCATCVPGVPPPTNTLRIVTGIVPESTTPTGGDGSGGGSGEASIPGPTPAPTPSPTGAPAGFGQSISFVGPDAVGGTAGTGTGAGAGADQGFPGEGLGEPSSGLDGSAPSGPAGGGESGGGGDG